MARKMIDCRKVPNDIDCTLTIAGTEDETLDAAVAHAVAKHGHPIRRAPRDDSVGSGGRFTRDAVAKSDHVPVYLIQEMDALTVVDAFGAALVRSRLGGSAGARHPATVCSSPRNRSLTASATKVVTPFAGHGSRSSTTHTLSSMPRRPSLRKIGLCSAGDDLLGRRSRSGSRCVPGA